MERMVEKDITDILTKINEDDESYLKLAKEVGVLAYGLHRHYKGPFEKIKS